MYTGVIVLIVLLGFFVAGVVKARIVMRRPSKKVHELDAEEQNVLTEEKKAKRPTEVDAEEQHTLMTEETDSRKLK